jgi:regulator of sigma E protease
MILFIWGEKKTPNTSVKYGIWVTDSLMHQMGFRNGDKVISVNGDSVKYFGDLQTKILIGGRKVLLERNGENKELTLPVNLIERLIENRGKRRQLILERTPTIMGEFTKKDTSLAKQAGVKQWDRILAVNSIPVRFFDEVNDIVQHYRNGQVQLDILRGADTLNLSCKVNSDGLIGMRFLEDDQYDSLGVYAVIKQKFGFFESFPAGIRKTGQQLQSYIDQFKLILNPETGAYKGVGGFKSMGSIFPPVWNWEAFWRITAFLSVILAFMNLLPIPALDGGHVMFTLYEMITRRKPNEKFLEYAQMVGMILLLGLMLYANGNDWFGWGR